MMTARASLDFFDLFENVDAAGVGHAHIKLHEVGRLVMGHAERGRAGVSL